MNPFLRGWFKQKSPNANFWFAISPEEPELVQDCSQEREEEKAGEDCKDQDPQGDWSGFWWFKGQHLSYVVVVVVNMVVVMVMLVVMRIYKGIEPASGGSSASTWVFCWLCGGEYGDGDGDVGTW